MGFKGLVLLISSGAVYGLLASYLLRPNINLDLVKTGRDLLVMRYEVTESQWQACVVSHGCSYQPPSASKITGADFPVTEISALDALEFVAWAQKAIDPKLRLPTLEEWYRFSGVAPYSPKKLFTDPRLAWAATYGGEGKVDPTLKQLGSFGSNVEGLADMNGNVWEWTASCIDNLSVAKCPAFYAAGVHEVLVSIYVRDPSSGGCATGTPPAHIGLRLVRNDDSN